VSVRLRAHHLLCMLTFVGEGYSPAFVANFTRIVDRIARGETIELVDGPDDVCAPLEADGDRHCEGATVRRRDRDARAALARYTGEPALQLTAADIAALRAQFATGTIRTACSGCEWSSLCTGIAASGYANVML